MKYIQTAIGSAVFFTLVFITTYLSMKYLSLQPSSSCLNCAYLKDVFFFSLISLFVVPLLILVQKKARLSIVVMSLTTASVFLIAVFFNNFNLFQDRESSWSSYSTDAELLAVLLQSFPYLTAGAIITFFIFYKLLKSWGFQQMCAVSTTR
ncbi:hypothetical protein [Pedobacter sp. GR22-6]|uniref:hypothetical protein n=1 Tax=Pedobacter sp. GR22-6 TaxID=3127957 RepID=UPI00307E0D5F